MVEFNDLDAIERALKVGDVACILTEPALTNIGMVLPQPGYLDGMAALAKKYGTLLIIDETHTISTGYGGYTRVHNLEAGLLHPGQAGRRRHSLLGLRLHRRDGRSHAPGRGGSRPRL